MAGRGGARPGSGRKRKVTVEEQKSRRDAVLRVFGPERWEKILLQVAQTVEGGDIYAVLPYLPYILGSPKQEINVSGTIEHVQMEAARKLLRVVGGTGD